jgi:hypothetical protein
MKLGGGMANLGATVRDGLSRVRSSTRRDGADRSGLAALLDLSVINAAGDALVTVALAGSLFFAVPTGEARSKVAMYLLITMVPFVLLAPVIGPLLDRVSRGRRTALAALCLGRGLIAWQLAGALDGIQVYPLALGLLMLSRAFGVARSAVIPRVAPAELTLLKVNARMSLVNIVAGAIAAPVGLGIANLPYVGYPWVLRLCALLYMAGVLLAFNLPRKVDSNEGERTLRQLAVAAEVGQTRTTLRTRLRSLLGTLPSALRATLVLRAIVGFLTFYLAFLLRTHGGNNLWLGGLAASAAFGSGLGVLIGGRLGRRRPEGIQMLALVLTTGGCLLAAVSFAKLTALLAALLAMLAGSMAKLALDAIIQRDVADDTRTSAFARSETALQLSWVAGGAFGLIDMPGPLGFTVAAAAAGVTLFPQARTVRQARALRRRGPQPFPGTAAAAGAAAAAAAGPDLAPAPPSWAAGVIPIPPTIPEGLAARSGQAAFTQAVYDQAGIEQAGFEQADGDQAGFGPAGDGDAGPTRLWDPAGGWEPMARWDHGGEGRSAAERPRQDAALTEGIPTPQTPLTPLATAHPPLPSRRPAQGPTAPAARPQTPPPAGAPPDAAPPVPPAAAEPAAPGAPGRAGPPSPRRAAGPADLDLDADTTRPLGPDHSARRVAPPPPPPSH